MSYDPYAKSTYERGNGEGFSVFDFKGKEITFFKADKAAPAAFDFIPFKITTKNHPAIQDGAKIGDEVFSLEYKVHQNVGPKRAKVVCLSMFGKPCPICEYQRKIAQEKGWKDNDVKALFPKARAIYNVINKMKGDNKIILLDASVKTLDEALRTAASSYKERKGLAKFPFASLTEGFTVNCDVTMKELPANKANPNPKPFAEYINFSFEKRDDQYPASFIDKAYPLDSFLKIQTYEQIENLFYGGEAEEDNSDSFEKEVEEEAPKKKEESKKESGDKCPHGGRYGVDINKLDNCDDCELWQDCRKEKKRRSEEVDL
jgi:hypothetical protein